MGIKVAINGFGRIGRASATSCQQQNHQQCDNTYCPFLIHLLSPFYLSFYIGTMSVGYDEVGEFFHRVLYLSNHPKAQDLIDFQPSIRSCSFYFFWAGQTASDQTSTTESSSP